MMLFFKSRVNDRPKKIKHYREHDNFSRTDLASKLFISSKIIKKYGKAKLITATNVFAHIDNINNIVKSILKTLTLDGIFISESHYLLPLIKTVQYDTIYHEHLRYYSLASLNYLFKKHNLEIIDTKEIPTHGGSIRVYAARKGLYKISKNVKKQFKKESKFLNKKSFNQFRKNVVNSKVNLFNIIKKIRTNISLAPFQKPL